LVTEWALYLRGHLLNLGWTPADLARSVGVSESSVSRWLREAVPAPDHVRGVARAMGRPEAEAMHIAGYGTMNIQRVEIRIGAEALSDDELLAEIKRRLRQRSTSAPFLERPGSVPAPRSSPENGMQQQQDAIKQQDVQ
jgi:transcriptional regulator with XRE-family HTH domain